MRLASSPIPGHLQCVAIRCRTCGAPAREAHTSASYGEQGLDSVMLHGVRAHVCTPCGHTRVLIDHRALLHREITHRLVRKRVPLAAEEVRFLRAHLRCSNDQLARWLGVTPATASRWASPTSGVPIAATADRLLRLLVAVRDGDGDSSVTWLGTIARAPAAAERIELWAVDDGWSAEPRP